MIELLTPKTCFVTLRSKKYEKEPNLKTEKYYEAKYRLDPIPQATLDEWANAWPKEGESLDLCPENIFVP